MGAVKTVPCLKCGRPAREVGQPGDCPDCGKTLCEACCDNQKREAQKPSALRGGK